MNFRPARPCCGYGGHFRFQASPCEICGGQIGTGTGYSLTTSVFPVGVFSSLLHTLLRIAVALSGMTEERSAALLTSRGLG